MAALFLRRLTDVRIPDVKDQTRKKTMKSPGRLLRALALALALTMLFCAAAVPVRAEEIPTFKRARDAVQWVQEHQPQTLDLGTTRFTPTELLTIRQALPAGADFRFDAEFRGQRYTPETESFNANGAKKQITREDLLALLELMPALKEMDVSGHRELSNKVMPDIVDAWPGVRFSWLITLPYSHSLSSAFTAYSTMNHLDAKRFTEKSLEIMKYAPDLQALDMGHNDIRDISFLRLMPKLELLILADNEIDDLTPLGDLKELRYCEIFMNRFSDLSPLSGCPELLDLNIVRTNVTSLDGLEGCTKLERLWAPQRKQVDEASIERFIASHPNCQLVWGTSDATGQGWRDHWRYKHYVSCFKTHQWIPFDAVPEEDR